ncbi:MAG: response regulator [Gemmatimonadota bacterium]
MPASLNILVVDDDERSLATVRRTLSNVPAEVVGVTSGEDALSLVETREFALAILDVEMAGMDGYELAERLRRTPDAEGLPIMFLSGSHGEDQHVFRGYESGAVDYLFKPFDPRVLTSKVNVFLELARKRLELAEYGLRLERMVEDRTRAVEDKAREVDVVMEGAPVALLVADLTGRVLRVNRAAERLLGYRREDLLGRPVDVLAPVDARPTHDVFGPALSHFHLGTRRVEVRDGRGETFPAHCSVNVVDGPDGSRRIISLEDARPVVELERARSELHALVEATDSIVLHAGLDGRVLHVNEAARERLGLGAPSERKLWNVFDLIDPEAGARLREEVEALGGEERVWRGQGAFRAGARGDAAAEKLRHDLLAVLRPRQRGAEGTLTLVGHR